jgi:hypothetical protein
MNGGSYTMAKALWRQGKVNMKVNYEGANAMSYSIPNLFFIYFLIWFVLILRETSNSSY